MTGKTINTEQLVDQAKSWKTARGLYWKDWMRIADSWLVLLIISVLVLTGLWMADSLVGAVCFFCILMTMQGPSTIMADKTCGWDVFECSLPVSRRTLVREKYGLTFALMLAGLVSGLLLCVGLSVLSCGSLPDLDGLQVNLYITLIIAGSGTALLIPLACAAGKDQFFLCVIASLLPAALMIWSWSQGIQSPEVTISAAGMITESIPANLNLPVLQGYALGSCLLWAVSWALVPGWLARRDRF